MFRKGQQPNILFAKSKMINFALCLHSVFLELSVQALAVLQFLTWLAGRHTVPGLVCSDTELLCNFIGVPNE